MADDTQMSGRAAEQALIEEANASWAYELGYDERAVKGLLDALGIPDADGLVLSDRVGILAARYMRARENS